MWRIFRCSKERDENMQNLRSVADGRGKTDRRIEGRARGEGHVMVVGKIRSKYTNVYVMQM